MSDIPDEIMKAARGCAQELLIDITDRRGWRQAWDQFDAEIRTEIADAHSAIIARALMAADEAATKRAAQWQPIETAPERQTVLATYQNSHKKWRTIKAVRYDKFSREITSADDLEQDYDEEYVGYYWNPGWYEIIENWDDYTHIVVGFVPSHWMPLPAPPILKGEA